MPSNSHSGPKQRLLPPASHEFPYPWVRLRSVRLHPFIYQRMLKAVDPAAKAGDVVAIYDKQDQLWGHGFYHDRSQVAIRILSFDKHPISEEFFRERIDRAVSWRERLGLDRVDTNAYRLVHAEGDGLSGLIAERYDDVIAIEVFSAGVYRRLPMFKTLLAERTGISRFSVRADEHVERIEGFHVEDSDSDVIPRTLEIREHGVRYRVDLRRGHKTGFFCDQRDNRYRLAGMSAGADVLDVCCYTGAFGICAMKLGGAASVTGVDLDEDTIALAQQNANLNGVKPRLVHSDAFVYMRQMLANERTFDVLVLDPPKFVPSREELEIGLRKYGDLNALAMSLVRPGGVLLTCSCSGLVSADDFMGVVRNGARRAKRRFQLFGQSGAGADHPVMSNCPESEYLKAVWVRVL